MRRLSTLLLPALLTLLLAACDKQTFYEPPVMPGTGKPIENPTRLTVHTGTASSISEDVVVYLLSADGGEVLASFAPGTPVDVEADKYLIVKTNTPWEGAAFEAPFVKLVTTATRAADGVVGSAPDVHAAHHTVDLQANQTHEFTLDLTSYTRTLDLSVSLQGITAEAIASVAYELTGVNHTAHLATPFGNAGSTGNATLQGTFPAPSADSEGVLATSASVRLLGLNFEAGQLLTVSATLADGSVQRVSLDAHKLLAGFYALPATGSIALHAVLSFGMDEVSGSIDGWTTGWSEDVKGE